MDKAPSRKQATFLQLTIGYVNTAIVIAQGLLLVPLYIQHIGSHLYGLWLASGGMLSMLGLVNFGMSSMLMQRISSAYGSLDLHKTGAYFVNGVFIYLGISLLAMLFGWLLTYYLPNILAAKENEGTLITQCFFYALVALGISIVNECLRGFCQSLLKPLIPMVAITMGRLIGIAVSIWMLMNDFGLVAIPAGLLSTETYILVINLSYSAFLFYKLKCKICLDKKILKEYFHSSPALWGAQIAQTISQESEPLLITVLLDPEITTAYIIVRRAADIGFNLLSQLVGSMRGSLGHLVGTQNSERISAIAYALVGLIALLGLVGFSIYTVMDRMFVHLWVGEPFVLSQTVIALLGVAFWIRIVRSMIWQVLNSLGEFIYTSQCIILEGLIRVSFIVIFLPIIGVNSVPIALIISGLLSLLLLFFKMHRNKIIVIAKADILKYLCSASVSFLSAIFIEPYLAASDWTTFLIVLVTVALVCLSIVFFANLTFCYRIKAFLKF